MRRGEDHGRAMRNARQVSNNHAETMVKRNGNADSVIAGKPHFLAYIEPVVDDVMVGQHGPFRKASRARGVLDVDYVIEIQLCLPLIKLGLWNLSRERQQAAP